MDLDQADHLLPQALGGAEPQQNLFRQGRADLRVPIKMPLAVLAHGKRGGFPQIMKERRQPEGHLRRHMVHGHGGVGVDVIAVVEIVLRKPHRRRQLREHHP